MLKSVSSYPSRGWQNLKDHRQRLRHKITKYGSIEFVKRSPPCSISSVEIKTAQKCLCLRLLAEEVTFCRTQGLTTEHNGCLITQGLTKKLRNEGQNARNKNNRAALRHLTVSCGYYKCACWCTVTFSRQ